MERDIQNGEYDGRVMTEEQMEILRKQISIYAVICEQLAVLHNSLSSFHPLSSGSGTNQIGGGYIDSMVASSSAHRISTRQRWTPTSTQLQILESLYEEGSGTPNRRRIREIATGLSEHGQITETNVYNWFQNRRARSKRKQPQTTTGQADDAAVTTEERRSCGDSGGFESYDHILFPSPDLGIEHLLSRGEISGELQR
uniref:WUSCHEL-related homeobox 14 n=1 Tax=Noccaea caerulescens TaxID=107243 RepID=A0A1J3IPL4_NOCCA